MPELPEVETVCRGLAPHLSGCRIIEADQRRPDLRVPFPENLPQRLAGRRVEKLGRRAKYILMFLSGGDVVLFHLGMSGRMSLIRKGVDYKPGKHDHLVLSFENGCRVVFNDPRRFGMVGLIPEGEVERHPTLAGLGPEPLDGALTGAFLFGRLKGRATSIKAALLDQRLVAGLGNIYVCEALFDSRIDPRRRAGSLKKAECGRLAAAIIAVLQRAIAAGGSSLRDYRQADGQLGYFQHSFSVYDRQGHPCAGCCCDLGQTGGVRRIVQGGRSTFYCPHLQK